MKKSKIIGIFTALTIMLIYGCSDNFLKDEKTDGISSEIVYSGDATAIAAVNGIYDAFQGARDGGPATNEYNTKAIFVLNRFTQDWKGNNADEQIRTYNYDPDGEIQAKMWNVHYLGIGRCNSALDNLPVAIDAGNIDTDLGNRLIGEALVLRSIFYHYLASTMGGVPLVLEIDPNDVFKPRNTQDEVFQQIASDLEDAVDKLPWSHSPEEKGRVTKGTAYAYLGSTYMWLRRYEDAVQAFEALEGHYTLEEDFLNIHDYENKNGPESIFEIQFTNNGDLTWNRDDNNTYLQSFCMPQEINGGGYGGYPTEELYESFEPGDERRDATIIPPGGEHPDPSIDIINYANVDINTAGTVDNPWYGNDGNSGPPEGRTGYYGVKTWRNPVVEGWNGPDLFGGENQIWLRYGEVLLSLAEAYHKSGNDTEAMNNIMKVRNRAGLTSEPPGPIMDAILNEYRHEIGGEFSLWPVLRRSGDHIEYIQNTFGVTIPPGRDLLPIPRIEIDINPNLEQNDAYK